MAFDARSRLTRVLDVPSRNYGIDLLRVVSMFYVLMLHTLGQGGVLEATIAGSPQHRFAWLLEIGAYGAVDIFALISGYVAYTDQNKKVNYSNYVMLWLQVVFYGVTVTLIYKLIHPELVGRKDLLKAMLPVTTGRYWYFTAYTGLFVILPLLNAGLRACSEPLLRKISFGIVLAFSVFETVFRQFVLLNGYSFTWIVLLYILGASIKKCKLGARLRFWQILLGIMLCHIAGWGWAMFGHELKFSNSVVPQDCFVSYISPTVLISSMLYVVGFAKLRIPTRMQKIVSFSAAGAFTGYILNCHKFIYNNELENRFLYLGGGTDLLVIFLHTVAFSLAFLAVSIALDGIRRWCFKILRVRQLSDCFVDGVNNLLGILVRRI